MFLVLETLEPRFTEGALLKKRTLNHVLFAHVPVSPHYAPAVAPKVRPVSILGDVSFQFLPLCFLNFSHVEPVGPQTLVCPNPRILDRLFPQPRIPFLIFTQLTGLRTGLS